MPTEHDPNFDTSERIAKDVLGEGPSLAARERGEPSARAKSDERSSSAGPARLRSLDALRGFDMFWIMGGAELAAAANERFQAPWLQWLARETAGHPEWHGFRFWDLIFPLFLFISGVTLPYSFGARRERGHGSARLVGVALRRGLLLVLLGCIYNGLLAFPPLEQIRFPSVLARIGLAWMCAAWIFLSTGTRGRVAWVLGLLLGYWAAMLWIPVPGGSAGDWSMQGNLASWIDRSLIPGRLHKGIHDPEGLFSTLPAIATALMGVLTGQWLRRAGVGGFLKAAAILLVGAGFVVLGWLWSGVFPLNKNLWTSSFALYSAGWSLLLLGVFYLVIDVWRLWRPFFPLMVIGLNPITIYLVQDKLIDFERPAHFLADGALQWLGHFDQALIFVACVLLLKWLFLYFLHVKRVYLKV